MAEFTGHTPGPWVAMDKLGPSHSDHGYRTVATLTRKGRTMHIYALAKSMRTEPFTGYQWGDIEKDAALIAAAPSLLARAEAAEAALALIAATLNGIHAIGNLPNAVLEARNIAENALATTEVQHG